jgi:hypothetical protein
MKYKKKLSFFLCYLVLVCSGLRSAAHDIYFCGEKIPLEDKLVAEKLMNIIKKQINYVNFPDMRQRVAQYMKRVEYFLDATNLPQDFKYLAIVESGFKPNAASGAGAVGFWQLMPKTAREMDLIVNDVIDERTDFDKSTYAAFRVLAGYYLLIKKNYGISSWVLTAAAYNVGIGNIKKNIDTQGKNYFSMSLNSETAAYVYKIIAIKELFEYPELYMKNFGYNVFNTTTSGRPAGIVTKSDTDISAFRTMYVNINESDGQHPLELKKSSFKKQPDSLQKIIVIPAKFKGKYKHINDGDAVSLELGADLQVGSRFTAKGSIIQGRAWIIDNRVMVDLGYDHHVTIFDLKNEKGILLSKLKKNERVFLKVTE